MVYEIQKTFILKDRFNIDHLKHDNLFYKIENIFFFYTKILPEKEIKFQKNNHNYLKIITESKELQKQEIVLINKTQFLNKKNKSLSSVVSKKRYFFKLSSYEAFIDVYKNFNLRILNISFPNISASESFKILDEFYVDKELKESIDEIQLSLYGYHFSIDILEILRQIDKKQSLSFAKLQSIDVFGGMKVLLYFIFKKLKNQRISFLKKVDKEQYFCFFENLQSLYIFLKNFKIYFDQEMISSLLYKIEECFAMCKKYYQNDEKISDTLILFISSKQIDHLWIDLEIFIKELMFYKNNSDFYFFKSIIAFELRKKNLLFQRSIMKKFDYEQVSDLFFELKLIINYTNTLFDIKKINRFYKKYFICNNSIVNIINDKNKFFKKIHKINKILKLYKG